VQQPTHPGVEAKKRLKINTEWSSKSSLKKITDVSELKENKTNTSQLTKDALGDASNPNFNNPDALDSYRLEQLEMAMGLQQSMKLTPKL